MKFKALSPALAQTLLPTFQKREHKERKAIPLKEAQQARLAKVREGDEPSTKKQLRNKTLKQGRNNLFCLARSLYFKASWREKS